MVDMVKKINKKQELLNPREKVIAATGVMKKGQFTKSVAAGAIGGVVGHLAAAAINKGDQDVQADSMADGFPLTAQSILAVTDQRWIVFEQSLMSGGPKKVAAEWPLDQIRGIDGEKGKLTVAITMTFADGSSIQIEAPKANKPMQFVEDARKVCVG